MHNTQLPTLTLVELEDNSNANKTIIATEAHQFAELSSSVCSVCTTGPGLIFWP
jgi:hypothetical protein